MLAAKSPLSCLFGSLPASQHSSLCDRCYYCSRFTQHALPTTAPAQKASDRSIRLVLVNAQEKLPQSYLLRVREPKEADDLLQAINENIKPDAE